jgi:hypothetical protein
MSLLSLAKTGLGLEWAVLLLQKVPEQCKALQPFDAAASWLRNFSSRGTRIPSWLGPCGRAGETDRDGADDRRPLTGRAQPSRSKSQTDLLRAHLNSR